jgi:Spy/CpxP family protein refolding chaperone
MHLSLPRIAALILAAAVVVPAVAIATDAPPAPTAGAVGPGGRHQGQQGGHKGQRFSKLPPEQRAELRERVKGKIQTYLTVELSSRAGLDEKKTLQLGSAIKGHLERKEATRTTRREAFAKLRELVDGKAADAALKAQMKTVVDTHSKGEAMDSLLDETAKFLTPTEQAKVMVAFPDVMKDAMKLVREARGKRGGGAGPDGDD